MTHGFHLYVCNMHPGDIVFFNKLAKGNCKQMGKTRSGSSVTASWSPCGRYFLTATTAPRLRVDNNVRVFNYVGELTRAFVGKDRGRASWECAVLALPGRLGTSRAAAVGAGLKVVRAPGWSSGRTVLVASSCTARATAFGCSY